MSFDSQINQCNNDIERYKRLRSKLETIASNLNSSSNGCGELKATISNSYSVDDGDSTIKLRTDKLNRNIRNTYSTIVNTVIPEINSAIRGLNSRVQNLIAQKRAAEERARELERQRREEEERKKRESGK